MLRQRKTRTTPAPLLIGLLLCLILTLPPARAVQAQTGASAPPSLEITGIDVSQFPLISVSVYGENLGIPLASAPLTVSESGAVREATVDSRDVGYQLALLFDASSNVRLPGRTGQPMIQDVKNAINDLAASNLLDDERDWVTFIALDTAGAPAGSARPRIIGPSLDRAWEDFDYQAVWNSVLLYESPQGASITPLIDLIRFGIEQFGDPKLPTNQQRHILIFSDGTDLVSVLETQQVAGLAQQANIRIHTAQLNSNNAQARRTMQQLAELTGGVFVELAAPETLEPIRSAIAATGEQSIVTFQSARANPGQIQISLALPDGRTVTDSELAPAVDVRPVEVTIVQPAGGFTLERTGGEWNTPLDALQPATLPVQLALRWPDGRPRFLTRLEVDIGGKTTIIDTPAADQTVELPVPLLGSGEYSIRARAVDEIGLEGVSSPIQIFVTEVRPPQPTPTPTTTPTSTPTPTVTPTSTPDATATFEALAREKAAADAAAATQRELTNLTNTVSLLSGVNTELSEQLETLSWVTIGSSALAVIALGFAIYVLSSRDRRKRATEIVTGAIRSVTEPFIRSGRKGGGSGLSRAQLVLVDNAGSPSVPATIALHSGNIRIGRDPSVSNVVLDDRRISRFHCQIREEPGGHMILDEGSTSGTYVNDNEVNIHGQMLQPGDMISVGPIAYRYERGGSGDSLAWQENTSPYSPTGGPGPEDKTEAIIPRPRN